MRDEWIKKCAGLALLVIAASVAYYFVIALPRHNAAVLEIEREKLAATERERQAKAGAEQKAREEEEKAHDEANMRAALNQRLFSICSDEADESYWSYVKQNGETVSGKSNIPTVPPNTSGTTQRNGRRNNWMRATGDTSRDDFKSHARCLEHGTQLNQRQISRPRSAPFIGERGSFWRKLSLCFDCFTGRCVTQPPILSLNHVSPRFRRSRRRGS